MTFEHNQNIELAGLPHIQSYELEKNNLGIVDTASFTVSTKGKQVQVPPAQLACLPSIQIN